MLQYQYSYEYCTTSITTAADGLRWGHTHTPRRWPNDSAHRQAGEAKAEAKHLHAWPDLEHPSGARRLGMQQQRGDGSELAGDDEARS